MKGWMVLGFLGQLLFSSRFIVQWIASEKKKRSHIPDAFWYLSIGGGILLFIYALRIKDPVFIVGQGAGVLIYIRNIVLISKAKNTA